MVKIVQAKTEEDCKICGEFMSKLINYEAKLDATINSNVTINGLFENNLNNKDFYFAYAIENNKPIGFVFGYLQVGKGKVRSTNILNLEALFVEENYRKNGVGKQLLKSFESWGKTKFGKDFVVEITYLNSNEKAKNFYESLGYRPVKTILRKKE